MWLFDNKMEKKKFEKKLLVLVGVKIFENYIWSE